MDVIIAGKAELRTLIIATNYETIRVLRLRNFIDLGHHENTGYAGSRSHPAAASAHPDEPRLFKFGTPPPILTHCVGNNARGSWKPAAAKLDEYYRTHALDDPVVISQGRLPACVPIPPPENAQLVMDAVVPHRTTQARRISSVYASNRTGPSGLDTLRSIRTAHPRSSGRFAACDLPPWDA